MLESHFRSEFDVAVNLVIVGDELELTFEENGRIRDAHANTTSKLVRSLEFAKEQVEILVLDEWNWFREFWLNGTCLVEFTDMKLAGVAFTRVVINHRISIHYFIYYLNSLKLF